MPDVSGRRPFLDGPLDVAGSETLLRWVNYLGTTFGTAGALCALRYYEGLSWISADARREVERHLRGLSLEETHSKKYDEPGHLTGPLSSLSGTPFGAHAKSLEFIATLADDDLQGAMLRARLAKHQVDTDHAALAADAPESGSHDA